MHSKLNVILRKLLSGDFSYLSDPEQISLISEYTLQLLNKTNWNEYEISCASQIIAISQIVYNNTDRSILFLDDGVYDLLLEKYRNYNNNFQVGAPVIHCNNSTSFSSNLSQPIKPIIIIPDPNELDSSIFYDDILKMPSELIYPEHLNLNSGKVISKKNINVPHKYPNLVGSLDKCKFTLNKEAIDRGVFNDSNVKIFERDFLQLHYKMGIIDMNTPFEMVIELKYDGVSVEADVTDKILSARSRGDANENIAADLSEIFEGYKFPYSVPIPDNESFGMKFEAIITSVNLDRLQNLKNKGYKNSRNAVIGLLGSSDAYDYRDLITLVPLATSLDVDRITEIEFLNKYYHSGVLLNYAVLRGTYKEILFQVYSFVKEAEALRPFMPFMYDGVVVSYTDPKIIKQLGRENSINKYSMAIKFNPLVREAIFNGYSYTVGQDGIITPMIHYTPVEFNGTIHTKSSGHSYKRFIDLNLAIGDVLKIEYTNDVMPYVTKSDTNGMIIHSNMPEKFPTNCPFCSTQIVINESGKSAICPNKYCPARIISRMVNMMDKLNVKDFGEETFRTLNTKSISELFNYKYNDLVILGPNNAEKFLERINYIKETPIYDYKIIGSIGFTGIAIETWKKVLRSIPINDILFDSDELLYNKLVSIKGIGSVIAQTIVVERKEFHEDIISILQNIKTIIPSFGLVDTGKVIRYSGCRPSDELTSYLEEKGCDANPNAGVTKKTDILIVPHTGFQSNKVSKLRDDAIIVSIDDFMNNIDEYL